MSPKLSSVYNQMIKQMIEQNKALIKFIDRGFLHMEAAAPMNQTLSELKKEYNAMIEKELRKTMSLIQALLQDPECTEELKEMIKSHSKNLSDTELDIVPLKAD